MDLTDSKLKVRPFDSKVLSCNLNLKIKNGFNESLRAGSGIEANLNV